MADGIRALKARNLRYKKGALASLGYEAIIAELYDIQEACSDVRWFTNQDDDTLLNALDGDEEAEWEFRMAFTDLDGKAYQLIEAMANENVQQDFDDCTVALIGNRYELVGYDSFEEDYFNLCRYEGELATSEAAKRFMRHTKAEMISITGQCLGTLIAFLDLRQQYDYLKTTIDILRGENTSLLQQIKAIDDAYSAAADEGFHSWMPETRKFDALIRELPDRIWIE